MRHVFLFLVFLKGSKCVISVFSEEIKTFGGVKLGLYQPRTQLNRVANENFFPGDFI